MDFAAARKVMVDSQVRVNDVTDRGLQAALLLVERERFCAADRAFACYGEVEVEIAGDRRLMEAREVAKLIQAVDARPGETALAIAAPYAAAVLTALGLTVTAQESDAAAADVVRPALEDAGVTLEVVPLAEPVGTEWDVIVSEGAVAVRPAAWLERLRVGGRLAVVERSGPNGRAVLYVRGREGFSRRDLFDAAPPILGEMTPVPAFAL